MQSCTHLLFVFPLLPLIPQILHKSWFLPCIMEQLVHGRWKVPPLVFILLFTWWFLERQRCGLKPNMLEEGFTWPSQLPRLKKNIHLKSHSPCTAKVFTVYTEPSKSRAQFTTFTLKNGQQWTSLICFAVALHKISCLCMLLQKIQCPGKWWVCLNGKTKIPSNNSEFFSVRREETQTSHHFHCNAFEPCIF